MLFVLVVFAFVFVSAWTFFAYLRPAETDLAWIHVQRGSCLFEFNLDWAAMPKP